MDRGPDRKVRLWLKPLGVENSADPSGEGVRRERLLKEGGCRLQDAIPHHGIVGIARQVKDVNPWPRLQQVLHQLPPAHPGHDRVGHNEVDRTFTISGHPNRLLAPTTSVKGAVIVTVPAPVFVIVPWLTTAPGPAIVPAIACKVTPVGIVRVKPEPTFSVPPLNWLEVVPLTVKFSATVPLTSVSALPERLPVPASVAPLRFKLA